jgi:ribonuclease P protein component
MIGQRHRFHGYGSLRAVYQRGQTVRGSALSLRFDSRESGKPYRVAVVVSRKVSKSAVVRNRIRRRIYEIVRQNDQQVPGATDLVFTVFAEQIAEMNAPKLQKIVTELLQKAQR